MFPLITTVTLSFGYFNMYTNIRKKCISFIIASCYSLQISKSSKNVFIVFITNT